MKKQIHMIINPENRTTEDLMILGSQVEKYLQKQLGCDVSATDKDYFEQIINAESDVMLLGLMINHMATCDLVVSFDKLFSKDTIGSNTKVIKAHMHVCDDLNIPVIELKTKSIMGNIF